MSVSASSSIARRTTSSSLPLPMHELRIEPSRSWMTVSTTSTPAVRASSRSSRRRSSASARLSRRARLSPTWTRMARPSLAVDRARAQRCARTRPRAADQLAEVDVELPSGMGPTSRYGAPDSVPAETDAGLAAMRARAARCTRRRWPRGSPSGASWIAATRSSRRRTRSTRSSRVSGSPRRCVCTSRSAAEAPLGGAQAADVRQHQLRRVADDDVVDLARAVHERADLPPGLVGRVGERLDQLGRGDALEGDPAPVDALEGLGGAGREAGGVAVDFQPFLRSRPAPMLKDDPRDGHLHRATNR